MHRFWIWTQPRDRYGTRTVICLENLREARKEAIDQARTVLERHPALEHVTWFVSGDSGGGYLASGTVHSCPWQREMYPIVQYLRR